MNEKIVVERKKRAKFIYKNVFQVILIGVIYYVITSIFDVYIPCPIYSVTHKYCPGCGITRMCVALIHLDFEAAFNSNCLLLFLLPIILVYGIAGAIYYVKNGKWFDSILDKIAVFIVFFIVMAFWIMRNMEQFAVLAPH